MADTGGTVRTFSKWPEMLLTPLTADEVAALKEANGGCMSSRRYQTYVYAPTGSGHPLVSKLMGEAAANATADRFAATGYRTEVKCMIAKRGQ